MAQFKSFMHSHRVGWTALMAFLVFLLGAGANLGFAQTQSNLAASVEIRIVEVQGAVQVLTQGASAWTVAQPNQVLHPFDRLQAAKNSRVALRWSDQSIVSFGASSELEILPPKAADDQAGLHLVKGIISFFHRDKPGHIHVITHGAVAGVEGTEFALAVDDSDTTTLSVIDGKVRFGNDQSTLLFTNGEQGIVESGKEPRRIAGFVANNLLQWCFYYPAVLDLNELQLADAEQNDLSNSLSAYRTGDLLAALAAYPQSRENISDREKVYHAALLLSVGEVAGAESILSTISDTSGPARLATALRQLIAAVKRQPSVLAAKPELASELMADSYFEQSRAVEETSLKNALRLARQATVVSPQFGFAWERVAELEFSFGRTKPALDALDTSHKLSPHNAQALALTGFILSAQNESKKARTWFDRAIAADPALGNAWLGRGLMRIHSGDKKGGKEDLLVAAALEPQRAELRSYLGKAYAVTGDDHHAAKELALAKKLDPNDPTAWLYSALLNEQDNEINDAIRDLEKSKELNNNRSVYRSQLLLDQDSAVRSANLAWMYHDDGLFDLSQREAARAVSTDYANYSAHLFLGNSYNELRDPNWSNLRYETPATAEFFIANLLAPTSAGILSPTMSEQQPYARLFDQNRFGVVDDTTYMDRGYHGQPAWTERGAAYATSDKLSIDFEATYVKDSGQRVNQSLYERAFAIEAKYQITPQDSVFFDATKVDRTFGDLNEYYTPPSPDAVSTIEKQSPDIYAGYHHEWSPGVHTLFLTSYTVASDHTFDPNAVQWDAYLSGGVYTSVREDLDEALVDIAPTEYSTELQQIWETPKHTTVVGARYSWGDVSYRNIEWNPQPLDAYLFAGYLPPSTQYPNQFADQNFANNFQHATAYGYHDWQILDSLKLSVGLAYDYLEQPADVNTIPFSNKEKSKSQVSPKAGLIWTPRQNTTLRAAYTRSLTGFANDASVRLEPTEVAGFNQAYRTVFPNAGGIGDTSGSRLDTIDISIEQKFDTGTYLALSGEILYSHLLYDMGAYYMNADDLNQDYPLPAPLQETLDFRERSLMFTADQLLGKQWAVGVRYKFSQDNLNEDFGQIPKYVSGPYDTQSTPIDYPFVVQRNLKSVLHTVTLHANWNHPSGLFAIFDADFYHQNNQGLVNQYNQGLASQEPGDDFWQFNATAGYRFWHHRAEVSGGILNIGNQNYSLEPLNLYNEMARSRTYFVRFIVSF